MVLLVLGFLCQTLGLLIAVWGVYDTRARYAPNSPGIRHGVVVLVCLAVDRAFGGGRIASRACALVGWILRVSVRGSAAMTLPRLGVDSAGSTEDQRVRVRLDEGATQQQVNGVLMDQIVWLRQEMLRLEGELSTVTSENKALESRIDDQGESLRANIAEAKTDGWAKEAAGLLIVLLGTALAFAGTVQDF
ncbi:hypothetical protein [Streptomyces sp. NPDC006274]|uniref:hypothetical protein n=1 Tax=unclassified Streptomyces TaxID=2593676 RepID=UPI0033B6C993